jgi:KAP-like P-loop domain-containing protein
MSAEIASGEKDALKSELIPDYALPADEKDRFDHQDYVDRLMALVEHVSVDHVSANVALFGAWGSGKSGIANRLAARIDGDTRFHYSYFDAFKFARLPLLRNFIAQMADDLLGDEALARSYKAELYEGTTRITLKLPLLGKWRFRGLLALTTVVCLILGGALAFWLFGTGRWHQSAGHLFTLLFAVAGLGALTTYLSTTRTREAPEGDEQFEAIFKRLLKELKVDGEGFPRLVVFVDELDRCAPDEVASTLESIRTFLGVEGCIFIVAADPQVLEYALTRHLRQATPPNLTNPYYSAGSAYLDKIFQYQLAFPPLRSRRMTSYALELIEGRGGCWVDPRVEAEDVVSVLLPTHVDSPRRVKVLLNSFALSWGVASERAARGSISELMGRELAKLVCLRSEFPLFARELSLDDRLCEAVLRAARAQEAEVDPDAALDDLPLDVRRRAISFAAGQLPVSRLLSRAEAPDPTGFEVGAEGRRDEGEEEGVEEGGEEEADPDQDEADAEREATVQQRYSVQLVRYLEKTEFVDGPRSDLIHLESAGAVWGLDAQLADELERDALDNRVEAVVSRLAALGVEDRRKALLMLGRRMRESFGTDADNTMTALLAAAADADQSLLDPIASQLIGDLVAYDERRGLRPGALPGALSLALAAGNEGLVDRVMAREELTGDNTLTFPVLAQADRLPRHHDRLVELLAVAIYEDARPTRQVLVEIDQRLARALLKRTAAVLGSRMAEALERAEELEEGGSAETAERGWVKGVVAETNALWPLLLGDDQVLAELAALPLYAVELEAARDGRVEFLSRIESAQTEELTAAILGDIDKWAIAYTEAQLRVLDPQLLPGISDAPGAMDRIGAHIWREREGEASELGEALRQEIERIAAAEVAAEGELTVTTVGASFIHRVTTDAELTAFGARERFARELVDLGLLPAHALAAFSLRTVKVTLEPPMPEPLPADLVEGLRESVAWLGGDAEADALRELQEALQTTTWLPDPARYSTELEILAALAEKEDIVVPTLVELEEAVLGGRADQEAVGIWVENFAEGPAEAFAALRRWVGAPSEKLLGAIGRYAAKLDADRLAELVHGAIASAFEFEPTEAFFVAARLADAEEGRVVEAIVGLFEDAGNEARRETVLDIWQWADPHSPDERQRLIDEVFLRLAEGGPTTHDLARRRARASGPSSGRRRGPGRSAAGIGTGRRAEQEAREASGAGRAGAGEEEGNPGSAGPPLITAVASADCLTRDEGPYMPVPGRLHKTPPRTFEYEPRPRGAS